jgi:hypothetical protein
MRRIFFAQISRGKENFETIISLKMLKHPFILTIMICFDVKGSTWS